LANRAKPQPAGSQPAASLQPAANSSQPGASRSQPQPTILACSQPQPQPLFQHAAATSRSQP